MTLLEELGMVLLTIKLIGYLLFAVLLGGIGTALYLLRAFIDYHG